MKLGNMFKKDQSEKLHYIDKQEGQCSKLGSHPEVPEGLMRKCNACRAVVLAESIIGNQYICPKCGNYFSVTGKTPHRDVGG